MRIKCVVIAVESRIAPKNGVTYKTLTCLDSDTGANRMKNTFDYAMSRMDVEKHTDEEALVNQTVELAVTELSAGFGGRMRFQGHILSAPKAATSAKG
jgi:hypothetical protein